MVSSADINNIDFGVQIDPGKQPIKRKSVGPGYVSHRRAPDIDDHLHDCIVVLKNVGRSVLERKLFVWCGIIKFCKPKFSDLMDYSFVIVLDRFPLYLSRDGSPLARAWFEEERNPSITKSQKIKSGETVHRQTCI